MGSPALADLDGNGTLDVVVGALDQRLYAFDGHGGDLPGFPVRLDSGAADDGNEIVNSPAIVDLDGDGKPEVVIATNEVLDSTSPSSPQDFDPRKLFSVFIGAATGNSVTYAVKGNGQPVSGWPVKTGVIAGDVLPLVVPGHDAAVGNIDPTHAGNEVSISAATGPARLLDGGGNSLKEYNTTPGPDALVSDKSLELNLAEYSSIGKLDDTPGAPPSVIKGGLSLGALANLIATNQNLEFNHTVQAWNPVTGGYLPGFPRATDDFQLLSQPVIARVGGVCRVSGRRWWAPVSTSCTPTATSARSRLAGPSSRAAGYSPRPPSATWTAMASSTWSPSRARAGPSRGRQTWTPAAEPTTNGGPPATTSTARASTAMTRARQAPRAS